MEVSKNECRSSLENNQDCSAALQADSLPAELKLSVSKTASAPSELSITAATASFTSSDAPGNAHQIASTSEVSRESSNAQSDATKPVSSDTSKPSDRHAPKSESGDSSSEAPKFPHNVWVNFGGVSYHFDRGRGFNEQNFGIGLEYEFNKDVSLAVGQYRNSIDRTSRYAAVAYTPLHAGNFSFGAAVGTVDGYYFRNGGFIPMAMPMATYETKHFGVNALYVPKMKDISSVVGVQFKVKF